jgi:peptide deformylase
MHLKMTLRNIVTPPNPTLRKKANKIRSVTPTIQTLADDMVETMRAAPGVGLAAPQVDVSQRLIVVEFAETNDDPDAPEAPPKLYIVINPEITRQSSETVLGTEGCLSLPGLMGEVERYEWVTVKGLDRHGNPFKKKVHGWLARIFQHEIDHLDGVLFIDRATEVYRMEEPSVVEPDPFVSLPLGSDGSKESR